MPYVSRRDLFVCAAGAAAFGLSRPIRFIGAAEAQVSPPPIKSYKIGAIDMMAVYDGGFIRNHDPGFIKNASVDDAKKALAASGMETENMPWPFVVPVAKAGGKVILFDAGTGGQIPGNTGLMWKSLEGANIKPENVDLILISHFHPDHIFGLMTKDENKPVFPKAQLVMPDVEYNWWTDPAITAKLPEARQGLVKRIQAVFPGWKDRIRLVGDNVEVAPGIRSVFAPGHTPGHTAWHVSSGNSQLMIMADTATLPALFVRNPGWHANFDQDAAVAEASRRKLFDRAVADKMMITGYHFPMPAVGTVVKDGAGYVFTPVA